MITQKIGDIRGMLLDADKRPVLRLLPELDEVCRGYVLNHLRDAGCSIEDIANQAWLLNATDWMRGLGYIHGDLCKDLDDSGLDRVLHEFAMKTTEDFLRSHEKQGGQVFKKSWDLLGVKRRWIEGEISDEELDNARIAYWIADRAAERFVNLTAYWAAYWAADWAADLAAYGTANEAIERKKQMELLGDMLEDSIGIQRGVKGKSLGSKVFGVSDGFG